MLDHVFMDAIGALREAMESALLERHAAEERLQVDVLLGDLTWETSYGLPGEGLPPRVMCEVTLEWSTWSQAAYRSWSIGEPTESMPEILIGIDLRVQRLKQPPDPAMVLAVLPEQSPEIGDAPLERSGPTVEQTHLIEPVGSESAIEVSYEGIYTLGEEALADGSVIDKQLSAMGGWIASMLVRLGDLKLEFLPPIGEEDGT